jgi:hypothetical protein
MPGTLLVHIDRGVREGAGDIADATGVVEVDVGDRHAGQVVGADTQFGQLGEEGRDGGLGSCFDEDWPRTGDEVARGHPRPTTEEGVDLQDARRQLCGGHRRSRRYVRAITMA